MSITTRIRARASKHHADVFHLQMEDDDLEQAHGIFQQRSMGTIRLKQGGLYELALAFNPAYPEQRVSTHDTMESAHTHFLDELQSLQKSVVRLNIGDAGMGLKT